MKLLSLRDFQCALVRVYLDAKVREALRAGDRSVLEEFALDTTELDGIQKLVCTVSPRVELFANTLCAKRAQGLCSFFPLLYAYIGKAEWERLTKEYCEQARTETFITPIADAICFAAFLKSYARPPSLGKEFGDVLALESGKAAIAADIAVTPIQTRVRFSIANTRPSHARPSLVHPARLSVSGCDPLRLALWVRSGMKDPLLAEDGPVNLIFFRQGDGGRHIGISRVGSWLATFIGHADGERTVTELVDRVEAAVRRSVPLNDIWGSLETLESLGVLSFKV